MATEPRPLWWKKALRILLIAFFMLGIEFLFELFIPRERLHAFNEKIVQALTNISPGQIRADARDAVVVGYSRFVRNSKVTASQPSRLQN